MQAHLLSEKYKDMCQNELFSPEQRAGLKKKYLARYGQQRLEWLGAAARTEELELGTPAMDRLEGQRAVRYGGLAHIYLLDLKLREAFDEQQAKVDQEERAAARLERANKLLKLSEKRKLEGLNAGKQILDCQCE